MIDDDDDDDADDDVTRCFARARVDARTRGVPDDSNVDVLGCSFSRVCVRARARVTWIV